MTDSADLDAWLAGRREAVDAALARYLPEPDRSASIVARSSRTRSQLRTISSVLASMKIITTTIMMSVNDGQKLSLPLPASLR